MIHRVSGALFKARAGHIRAIEEGYDEALRLLKLAYEARARNDYPESRTLLTQAMDAEYAATMDVCDALSELGDEWGVTELDELEVMGDKQ